MFAQSRSRHGHGRRRGVVLLLILAMLSIVALLGVTFATISGQAQVGAQYYAQAINNTNPTKIFDFAIEQLINDTNNPKSAIRGHSLLRDMYGHDGRNNGYFPRLPDPLSEPMYVVQTAVNAGNIVITTNIPTWNNPLIEYAPDLFGRDFTGWTLRLQLWNLTANHYPVGRVPGRAGQTFIVTADNFSGAYHQFQLSASDLTPVSPIDPTPIFAQPNAAPGGGSGAGTYALFELDARYRKAFNGTGQSLTTVNWAANPAPQVIAATSYIPPEWPNFLFNNPTTLPPGTGYTDPANTTSPSMDEDYDAPDAENWFMAIKSADGQVIIPSFFRPWTIVIDQPNNYSDWTALQSTVPSIRAKFLRPRKIDHPASGDSFPDLTPDPVTGKITYDVDNDGDGVTDSVWLDLGYPIQRDASGKLFKPLFAIMCLPLNGRLPLNTAGNMDGRVPGTGARSFDHATGRGYSANEVDPRYALNGVATAPLTPTGAINPLGLALQYSVAGTPTGNTIGLTNGLARLQTLLGGRLPTPGNESTEGRYGETNALIQNQVPGPGRSYYQGSLDSPWFDANYNSIDFYPGTSVAATATAEGIPNAALGSSDYLDTIGRNLLPTERFRRFVTPMDITGNGRLTRFDELPSPLMPDGTGAPYGTGFDDFGRVGFFHYFRPPGVVADALEAPAADPMNPALFTVDITRTRLNQYHGYEAHRNPIGAQNNQMGRASWNIAGTDADNTTYAVNPPAVNGYVQTYEPSLSTDNPVNPPVTGSNVSANIGFQEAAQLNLYRPDAYDEPFTNQDVEWLLRRGDIDGTSLDSRLPQLLPDYFVNNTNDPSNGALYRQLFSVDSWEPNASTWAVQPNGTEAYLTGSHIAHRERRVNLNFPLPPSTSPNEATRQKWARETYELMKVVMFPPDGISYRLDADGFPEMYDTVALTWVPIPNLAEKLYEMGQYALNIVDFRDPDATMTHLIHTDLDLKVAVGATPAGVQLAPKAGQGTLEMYGMEYQPVAINEVMALQYVHVNGTNEETPRRLFIELANILTMDNNGTNGAGGTASDLDLEGWGFVITPDEAASPPGTTAVERPNTMTGQLGANTITNFFVPIAGTGVGTAATFADADPLIMALDATGLRDYATGSTSNPANRPQYYLLANTPPADNAESTEVSRPTSVQAVTTQMDELVNQLPTLPKASGDRHYYWLHLLRPADPLSPATSPKVIIDSIRFPYFEAGYAVRRDPMMGPVPDPQAPTDVYSVGRFQPLRGGQLVPNVNNFTPPYPYGVSDQIPPDQGGASPFRMHLNGQNMVQNIYESLGRNNNPDEDPAGGGVLWHHFPFHDRDFAGVAELFLVPNVAPGLFTKQFSERRGTNPNDPAPAYVATIPNARPTIAGGGTRLQKAATYPYLPDGFFYTSITPDPVLPAPPTWNKFKGVGWHKLLDFVEVPSAAFGSIGPADEGDNGDWLRQDLRPGMVNLNAIFDEEVFFGLIADPRLNTAPVMPGRTSLAATPNVDHPTPAAVQIPQMVTSLDQTGTPNASYPVSDTTLYPGGRGFYDGTSVFMKAAFSDFLKLRHGGSNYVGLMRSAQTGFNLMTQVRNQFADRPFHSMSWPNLHDTLMRPARLENYQRAWNGGLTNTDQTQRPMLVSTPPRLLFQVPDAYDPNANAENDTNTERGLPDGTPITDSANGRLPDHTYLSNPMAGLANTQDLDGPGVGVDQTLFLGAQAADRREHPAFRYDWMQKVLNLGTVRSHQYAVWVTVGFFEVVQEGNAQLALTNPTLVVDQLGREVGKDRGENVRHRSFFIIDRARAIGFDPTNPGNFRDLVSYQRRIQ